jgi:serine/threonine protein phosphatase PrpC
LSGANRLTLKVSGLSDVGRVREHNEDSFDIDVEGQVYVVADGMGGHRHGEVASRIAVEAISAAFHGERDLGELDEDLPEHLGRLKAAIESAQAAVQGAVEDDVALVGMGTTVVAMIVHDDTAGVAHVGDSRGYRFRDGMLEQLTKDHTWVGEQVGAGLLSEEQAKVHPLRNVVTRALGGRGGVEVDVSEISLKAGDLYLLCSDGLTGMLSDLDIGEHLTAAASIEEASRNLISSANENGGVDNTTVVIVQVLDSGESSGPN